MPRRRAGRFVRSRRVSSRRRRAVPRSFRTRARSFGGSFRRATRLRGHGSVLQRPVSKGVAPALGLGALAMLASLRTPNGDSAWSHMGYAIQNMENGGGIPSLLIDNSTGDGVSGTLAMVGAGVSANALPAIGLGIGAAIVRGIGGFLGI